MQKSGLSVWVSNKNEGDPQQLLLATPGSPPRKPLSGCELSQGPWQGPLFSYLLISS